MKDPAGHFWQPRPFREKKTEYVKLHEVEKYEDDTVPSAQSRHELWPEAGWYCHAGHVRHFA
jgi:hypothetical protein